MSLKVVDLGEVKPSCLRYLKALGKAFDDNFTTALKTLISLHKLKAIPAHHFGNSEVKKVNCSLPMQESILLSKLLHKLDQLKNNLNLESRAAVLEQIILKCGVSFVNGAVHFNLHDGSAFFENLNSIRIQEKFCDITIKIGETSLRAHKVVLATHSQYFSNTVNDELLLLKEEDVTADSMTAILNFLYTGKVAINSANFHSLHHAAQYFQISKLCDVCSVYDEIQKSVSNFPDNLCLERDNDDSDSADNNQMFEIQRTKRLSILSPHKLTKPVKNGNPKMALIPVSDNFQKESSITNQSCSFQEPANKVIRKKNLKCPTCHKQFSQLLTYKLHLLCHDENPTYKCFKCDYIDSTFGMIREHMRATHTDVTIESDGSVEISSTDNDDDVASCDKCEQSFPSSKELANHMQTHRKTRSAATRAYNCRVCHKNFRSSSHLKRHMVSHTGERKYCCITCGKLFLKSDHLKRHEKIHTSERPFTCEECGKTFRDKDHLKRHHLTHTEERPYFCEMCGKQFKDKSTLISHQKCHDDAALACETCGKLFKSEERLETHRKKHLEAKPHSCDVCGKKFPFKGRLRKHMISHTDARPFHCETCGKQFRDSHSLRLHQKKHTGIGLHPCLECGKQFTNACHLRRHGKVHSGEKPHACDVCKRAFARVDNLEAHRRICSVQQQMKGKSLPNGFSSQVWDSIGSGQDLGHLTNITDDDNLPPTMVKPAMTTLQNKLVPSYRHGYALNEPLTGHDQPSMTKHPELFSSSFQDTNAPDPAIPSSSLNYPSSFASYHVVHDNPTCE
uniref:Zinc finger protein 865 n=1 Tax=Phallusia mammillata TaxID=59560 RepID=A0A6F9DMJ9_9ASCI|nr:myoneurin [Phallusia mammillata]